MSKKIGVLTFHRAYNFGAILQACALQHILKGCGHRPELIDYRCPAIDAMFSLEEAPERYRRGYAELMERMTLSLNHYDHHEALRGQVAPYDAVIVGSDQVWNTSLTEGDPAYFLDFVPPETTKISYAASFGKMEINERYATRFEQMFRTMEHISVREESGRNLIRRISGKEARVVLDPTFLLDAGQWNDYAEQGRPVNHPYLLAYLHCRDPYALEIIRKLKKELRLPVVVIGHTWLPEKELQSDLEAGYDKYIFSGPSTYLNLFQNAEFIVTNSYHGTIFPMIFRKPFLCTPFWRETDQHDGDTRLYHLLESVGLAHRWMRFGKDDFPEDVFRIHYDKPVAILDQERQNSVEFLEMALNFAS